MVNKMVLNINVRHT